jgi:hypothetical protein
MSNWTEEDEEKATWLAKEFSRLCHGVAAPVVMTAAANLMDDIIRQTLEKFPEQKDNILMIVNVGHDKLVEKRFGSFGT